MLATFVIGLREGLEAALIVGIIAAFLKQDGKARALRMMWLGVGLAVVLCLGIGLALALLSGALPQRQQEMLETVIGLVAVAMVTWMVLWMRKHSRSLKKELGAAVGGALAAGTSLALVGMAFLAVVREGVETAVFLVAASQTSAGGTTFVGAALGISVAVVLGYLIYRGGVRINLSKFFRITGVVLVLVAGGVLMSSLYYAYEADWIVIGGQTWIDLSSVIQPGSVQESLLTGVLGIRAELRAIDVIAWLLYVVPMLAVTLWPQRRMLTARVTGRMLVAVGGTAAVVAIVLAVLVPRPAGVPASQPFALVSGTSDAGALSVQAGAAQPTGLPVRLDGTLRVDGVDVWLTDQAGYPIAGADDVAGRGAVTYRGSAIILPASGAGTETITAGELAVLNGGRYPVGLRAADADVRLTVTRNTAVVPTVAVDRSSGRPLSLSLQVVTSVIATQDGGRTHRVPGTAVSVVAAPAAVDVAGQTAATAASTAGRAATLGTLLPWMLGSWGVLLVAAGALLWFRRRSLVPPSGGRGSTPDVSRTAIPDPSTPADRRVAASPGVTR